MTHREEERPVATQGGTGMLLQPARHAQSPGSWERQGGLLQPSWPPRTCTLSF